MLTREKFTADLAELVRENGRGNMKKCNEKIVSLFEHVMSLIEAAPVVATSYQDVIAAQTASKPVTKVTKPVAEAPKRGRGRPAKAKAV